MRQACSKRGRQACSNFGSKLGTSHHFCSLWKQEIFFNQDSLLLLESSFLWLLVLPSGFWVNPLSHTFFPHKKRHVLASEEHAQLDFCSGASSYFELFLTWLAQAFKDFVGFLHTSLCFCTTCVSSQNVLLQAKATLAKALYLVLRHRVLWEECF